MTELSDSSLGALIYIYIYIYIYNNNNNNTHLYLTEFLQLLFKKVFKKK